MNRSLSFRAFFAIGIFALAGLIEADWSENPILKLSQKIGETGLSAKPAPEISPLKFKPSGKRLIVKPYAAEIGSTAEERDALESAMISLFESYEGIAKEIEVENDGALALGFSVAILYSVAKGSELDDAAFLTLSERFQSTFNTDEIKKIPDLKKQEFYEISLCTSSLVLALNAAVQDEDGKAKMKELAKAQLKLLLGIEIEQISLNGEKVSIKGISKTSDTKTVTSPTGETPKDFSYTLPSGWVDENGWKSGSLVEARSGGGNDVTSAHVRFLPAMKPSGSFSDALRKAWADGVPDPLKKSASGMVYRRYLGDGIVADFIFAIGKDGVNKLDASYTVYLLDLGSVWLPMVVAQTYVDAYDGPGGDMSAGFSFGKSADLAEVFYKSFQCPSAKNRVFVDKASVVGDYSYGTSSSLQWENIYTGATSMTFVSYGGTLNIKADGSFTYTFVSASGQVGAAKFGNAKGAGKWRIERDLLICDYTSYDQGDSYKRTKETYRIAGLVQFSDGQKVIVLKTKLDLPMNPVTVSDRTDYYSTKKKD